MENRPVAQAYRFCPQCGAKTETVGNIPFQCPTCEFTNYFGPVAAVGGIVVNQAGKMMLIRRAREPGKGKWGLPGGFVDAGETAEQAVAREVLEEVGLQVERTKF